MKIISQILTGLCFCGIAYSQTNFYVLTPVVHDPKAGIYTGIVLTNCNTTISDGVVNFQLTAATLVFWEEDGNPILAYRKNFDYTETFFIQTGDLFNKPFKGSVTINTTGKLTGCAYVILGNDHFQATMEEVSE